MLLDRPRLAVFRTYAMKHKDLVKSEDLDKASRSGEYRLPKEQSYRVHLCEI